MVADVSDSIAASTSAVAGLFPGQGSQTSDLRALVARAVPGLLERCIELVGEDPFERLTESTRFAQPAIYCGSVAGWLEYSALVRPLVALAGHSLGELAALVAAGAIDQYSGLELAVTRGALMAEASEGEVAESMLALLRAEPERAERWPPNMVCGGQRQRARPDRARRSGGSAARGRRGRPRRGRARDAARRRRRLSLPGMAGAVHPTARSSRAWSSQQRLCRSSRGEAAPFEDVREELAQAIIAGALAPDDGGARRLGRPRSS